MKLAPISLRVLAQILTNRIDLTAHMPYLQDSLYQGRSWSELRLAGFAPLKISSVGIRCGLAMVLTESPEGQIVWVNEIRCHPYCSVLGDECQAYNRASEWLKKLYKKHTQFLDTTPGC